MRDRNRQIITVGSHVIYTEYERDSSLYTGIVQRETPKKLYITGDTNSVPGSWNPDRQVSKTKVEEQLIVIP